MTNDQLHNTREFTEPQGVIQFALPPKTVGYYQLGDSSVSIHLTRRPNWLVRLMARWLLDWRWYDGKWRQR